MRRAHRLFIVAAGACVLVACNLIAGFESDYTVSGTDSGSTSETSNQDGPNPEGSPDGPVGNDGSPESSTDGGTDGPVCPDPSSLFCDDFENADAGAPNYGWTGRTQVLGAGSGAISVTAGVGMNGSRGLSVTLTNVNGGQYIYLEQILFVGDPSLHNGFQADFDFQVKSRGPADLAFAMITFPAESDTNREHGLAYWPNAVSKMGSQGGSAKLDTGQWHHGRIVLDRATSGVPLTRRLFIDGDAVEVPPGSAPTNSNAGPSVLRVGAFNLGAGVGTTQIVFDNVVLRGN